MGLASSVIGTDRSRSRAVSGLGGETAARRAGGFQALARTYWSAGGPRNETRDSVQVEGVDWPEPVYIPDTPCMHADQLGSFWGSM